MKTAISIPDDLFTGADELARRLGISRSELYATAVAEFLAKHEASEITTQLNRVYAAEPGGLSAELRRLQRRSVGGEDW